MHRTAKIVGGVVGGVAGLIIVGMVAAACYSWITYRARSQRRHIQDAVYNLVMGTCHDSRAAEDFLNSGVDLHVRPPLLHICLTDLSCQEPSNVILPARLSRNVHLTICMPEQDAASCPPDSLHARANC